MHSLDVDADVRRAGPTWHGGMRLGRRARTLSSRRWSMFTQSGVVAGSSLPVERGVGLRDDRPGVRVGGGFAGEVAGVEFFEGGVDVVEVEQRRVPRSARRRRSRRCRGHRRGTPRVARSLPESGTMRTRRSPRVAMTVDVDVLDPDVGDRPQRRRSRRPDRVGSGVHHASTIVAVMVVGQHLRHRVPVAGREATSRSARQLGLPRFPAAALGRLSSSNLASAASRSASSNSSERLISRLRPSECGSSRHSASKPSCEVPCADMGDDRSEVAQPMHSLDVDLGCQASRPTRRGCMRSCRRARKLSPRRWSMFTQSGVVAGSSRRLNAA